MNKIKYAAFALLAATIIGSCSKNNGLGIDTSGGGKAPSGAIKAALPSGVLFGFAVNYNLMSSNTAYANTVKTEANFVTFENELKYGSIVQNDGSFNFSTADALYNLCSTAGLQVFGHNLLWYQQQNTTYLNGIVGGGGNVVNLLSNSSFETWPTATAAPTGWSYFNGSTYFSQGTGAANVYDGTNSLAISGYGATGGSAWHVQLGTSNYTTVSGHQIKVSFWAKSTDPTALWQVEGNNGNGPSYSGTQSLTTAWAQYSYSFTAASANPTITFDMGDIPVGSTVYIDKVIVEDLTAEAASAADPVATANRVDSVLHLWVNAAVSHYAGKIKAWDVVNELFADDGTIRTSATGNGVFVWAKYLGKDAGVKAFTYAHAADPNALLFINDYGLECNTATSTKKLDSLIAYISYLKSKGVQVDGIGTQMHIGINTSKTGIDYMFKQLAATGLKIRISELDVALNQFGTTPPLSKNFTLTPEVLGYQKATYQQVVSSYLQNVPAAQRYGITVWGVDDPHSWLYNNGTDYPLLFDSTFTTKPAYDGFLQGLKQ